MAKKKSRSKAKSTPPKASSEIVISPAVKRTLWILISLALSLFVTLACFNAAGAFGTFFYDAWRASIGHATPLIPLLVVWLWFRRYMPQVFRYRWDGVLAVVVGFVALLLSFAWGNTPPAGGFAGAALYETLGAAFGVVFTQFLTVLLFIGSFVLATHQYLGRVWTLFQAEEDSATVPSTKPSPSPDLSSEELARVPVIEGQEAASPGSLDVSAIGTFDESRF
jgi:hypothetical protein